MCVMCSITYAATGAVLLVTSSGVSQAIAMNTNTTKTVASQITTLQILPTTVASIKSPKLTDPVWLQQQKVAEATASRQAQSRVVTYDVTTRGIISASLAEFRSQANATLNDSRGWSRLGVAFQEVSSGGMFTLILSEASSVASFPGCSAEYSCRSGRNVIINQDRWLGATVSWNNAGGSLRDYRHMVVNHETGHWLGHEHQSCGGPGQSAPVMQQQSIDLQGCSFNPWPLSGELWSTQLGIQKS